MKVIEVPLTFLRNYTCPMAQASDWDRDRAAILPATTVMAFFYLAGNLNDYDYITYFKIGLLAAVPGAMIGVYIRMRTK